MPDHWLHFLETENFFLWHKPPVPPLLLPRAQPQVRDIATNPAWQAAYDMEVGRGREIT